jgi:predicted tellurium resistance membrane protein TerC
MDKHPVIIYLGAAVLGRVAGEMMITDPFIHNLLHPGKFVEYGVQAVFAVGVIVFAKLWMRWKIKKHQEAVPDCPEP